MTGDCGKCGSGPILAKGLCGACYQRAYRRQERSEQAICAANLRRLEREQALRHTLAMLREM